jgi:hypothetical protein
VTADDQQPMKPQDTVIFLLGELKGQLGAVATSVDAHASAQALINARHETEHTEFREGISGHDSAIAVLKEQMPKRTPWWSVAAGVGSLVAIAVVAVTTILSLANR